MKPNDNNKSYQAKQQEQQTAEQSENGFSETSASPEAVHNSKAAPLPLTKSSTTATTTSSNSISNNNNNTSSKGKPSQSKLKAANDPTPTDIVLPSISVLVVEDNAINQAILGAFYVNVKFIIKLQKWPKAIDKWKREGFTWY